MYILKCMTRGSKVETRFAVLMVGSRVNKRHVHRWMWRSGGAEGQVI